MRSSSLIHAVQVLLWNYPGQAFSEWRDQQLLNNEYLSTILQYLLLHLGSKTNGGTGEKRETERVLRKLLHGYIYCTYILVMASSMFDICICVYTPEYIHIRVCRAAYKWSTLCG